MIKKTGSRYEITWENRPIPGEAWKLTLDIADRVNIYTLPPPVAKTPHGLTDAQYAKLWVTAVKVKTIRNHAYISNIAASIANEYVMLPDIVRLSQKYDFPPVALLHMILVHMPERYTPKSLATSFSYPYRRAPGFSERDALQFDAAVAADHITTINPLEVAATAQAHEDEFVAYIKGLGIPLRTQAELVAEQTRKYGRAVVTPDILFDAHVTINGSRVHWIDYKSYIGTTAPFLCKSTAEQAKKYNKEWGPGAIAYRGSFITTLSYQHAILLDVSTKIAVDEASSGDRPQQDTRVARARTRQTR